MSRYRDAVEEGYDGPSPREERRARNRMMRHPDCRDPCHPGCCVCCPDDKDEDTD